MPILEMKVPSPGESISEVEIAAWLVNDGDYVEKDQPIAEVDSDKATLELPAEMAGVITLKVEEGDVVPVGDVCCIIDTDAKRPAGMVKSAEPTAPDQLLRRLLQVLRSFQLLNLLLSLPLFLFLKKAMQREVLLLQPKR